VPVTEETESLSLLPTPVFNDMGAGKTIEEWETLRNKWKDKFKNDGHGKSLAIEVLSNWNEYLPAVKRWEKIVGRPHPNPISSDEENRMNPALSEWMMGYPEGWVNGMSRRGKMECLGNAIVPHQAAKAWSLLIERRNDRTP